MELWPRLSRASVLLLLSSLSYLGRPAFPPPFLPRSPSPHLHRSRRYLHGYPISLPEAWKQSSSSCLSLGGRFLTSFLVHGGCPPASITQKRPNHGQVSPVVGVMTQDESKIKGTLYIFIYIYIKKSETNKIPALLSPYPKIFPNLPSLSPYPTRPTSLFLSLAPQPLKISFNLP